VAADSDALAPALRFADHACVVPPIRADNYLEALLEVVRSHGVRLLVPTIDTELDFLARNLAEFEAEGCRVVSSLPHFVRKTADKWLTHEMFVGSAIPGPVSWLPGDGCRRGGRGEVVVKPRCGSASRSVFIVDATLTDAALRLVPDAILQERLTGAEATVDVLYDDHGELLHYVPRLRLKAIGGESVVGRTLDDTSFRCELLRVLRLLGTLGARLMITVQMFLTDRGPMFTEVNPRFGGGFPLGHAAGARYPEWLVAWASGCDLPLELGHYRRNLVMSRYYSEALFPA